MRTDVNIHGLLLLRLDRGGSGDGGRKAALGGAAAHEGLAVLGAGADIAAHNNKDYAR